MDVHVRVSKQNCNPTHLPNPLDPAQEPADPTLVTVGSGSPPLELKNGKSVGRFSPQNSKKPDQIEIWSISRRSFLDPTRSQPFLARSQLDPWNLHWIWQDLTRSGETSPNLVRFLQIQQKYHRNFADFDVNSLEFGWFSDLQLQPNRLPSVEGRIHPIQSTTSIDDGLKFWPSDLVGLVPGWAQTRPGPTREHAYVHVWVKFNIEQW